MEYSNGGFRLCCYFWATEFLLHYREINCTWRTNQSPEDTYSDNGVMVGKGLCRIHWPHVFCCGPSTSCNICSNAQSYHNVLKPLRPIDSTLLVTYATCWWQECGCHDRSGTLSWNRPRIPEWEEAWRNWVGRQRGRTNSERWVRE